MAADANSYSRRWFETFLGRIDASAVEREVAFLHRQLGPSHRILDLCCGPGRHAAPLATAGYDVIGLDRDAPALHEATSRATAARFVLGDMRSIPLANHSVDAVICMWQSFGQLDARGNVAMLAEMARVLGPGGTLALDLYHREFHELHLGDRTLERDGARVHEHRSMHSGRLRTTLRYENGGTDEFDWLLYTPNELAEIGTSAGLTLLLACAEFDEHILASGDFARMQTLFRKT